jgi:hypothetical protein
VLRFIETGFNGAMVLVFSSGIGSKRDSMKADWPVKCSRLKPGWSFIGFGNNFLDGYGHWMRRKQIIRVNQLSETKLYPQSYVNKSITALFAFVGFYGTYRNISISPYVQFRIIFSIPVLSTKLKSSTFPMVYVAGFFQLAGLNYY